MASPRHGRPREVAFGCRLSAIMTVVTFVGAETMSGLIDASTT
jgi:hypothetical protein